MDVFPTWRRAQLDVDRQAREAVTCSASAGSVMKTDLTSVATAFAVLAGFFALVPF